MEDVADSTDEHKHVVPSSPTCTLPCTDPYPGPYSFQVMLEGASSNKRSWVVGTTTAHKALVVQV